MNLIVASILFLVGIPIAVIVLADWYHFTPREAALVYFLLMLLLLMATADNKNTN